jgi:hypothetical protein
MLFRALTIVCAASLALSLSGCVSGEVFGGMGCPGGNENAITLDGNPVPGNGDDCEHIDAAWCAQQHNFRHAYGTVEYWAFNTNTDYPPYEEFCCDQWSRAMYQVGKKFDEHFLNYDWDDPFIECCPPDCNRPRCSMRYTPCKPKCNPCEFRDPCPYYTDVYYTNPCPPPSNGCGTCR